MVLLDDPFKKPLEDTSVTFGSSDLLGSLNRRLSDDYAVGPETAGERASVMQTSVRREHLWKSSPPCPCRLKCLKTTLAGWNATSDRNESNNVECRAVVNDAEEATRGVLRVVNTEYIHR